ncbi:MAG: hypothetical protein HDR88_17865 [Bacteroides sp.]|nr:hypothetical protein [Bacteroides sp.]
MKKIILYIVLGILVVVGVIKIFRGNTGEYGSKAKIEVPLKGDVNVTAIKNVTFIVDNSGSMRGYIDFSGNNPKFKDAKKTLLSITGTFMSNCENILHANTIAECNKINYDIDTMLDNLTTYSAFSGPITEVNKLLETAITKCVGDSSICVIVSDLILSHGKRKLLEQNDHYYNLHSLTDLQTSVRNQFHKLKNEDKGVLIVKYDGDFNGKYYYNYTENLEVCTYKDSLMQKRPFYFVAIGKNKALKDLCNSDCIPSGYSEIFTSLSLDKNDMIDEEYSVRQPFDQPQWILGNPDPRKADEAKKLIYSISINKNIKTAISKFTFTFPSFILPIYVNKALMPDYNKSILNSVSNIINFESFEIETRPFNEMGIKRPKDIKIKFNSPRYIDYTPYSTLDDVKSSLSEMTGKTWGLESVIQALYEVYDIKKNDVNEVVSIKFRIFKQ